MEYEIRSVLQEAKMYKEELRHLSSEIGLPKWNKPSLACLSSRIPYGSLITLKKVGQLDRGEEALRQMGFRHLRIRHHDAIGRIEVAREEFPRVMEKVEEITETLKVQRFTYETLDLQGYRSGSMNETLKQEIKLEIL